MFKPLGKEYLSFSVSIICLYRPMRHLFGFVTCVWEGVGGCLRKTDPDTEMGSMMIMKVARIGVDGRTTYAKRTQNDLLMVFQIYPFI